MYNAYLLLHVLGPKNINLFYQKRIIRSNDNIERYAKNFSPFTVIISRIY